MRRQVLTAKDGHAWNFHIRDLGAMLSLITAIPGPHPYFLTQPPRKERAQEWVLKVIGKHHNQGRARKRVSKGIREVSSKKEREERVSKDVALGTVCLILKSLAFGPTTLYAAGYAVSCKLIWTGARLSLHRK